MADLSDVNRRHGRYLDSMLDAFETHLRMITIRAQASLTGYLQRQLSITDGTVDRTPGNLRIIRSLDDRFMEYLDDAGYNTLLNSFTNEFTGQTVFLQDILQYLGIGHPVGFTASDLNLFTALKLNAITSLEMVAETAARNTMQRAMFSIAGLKFSDLVEMLATRLETSVGKAKTIADTAQISFYRTMTDATFRRIEADLPEEELEYVYSGPDDSITRPFCEHLLKAAKSYTRAKIDQMSNGQIPNVMISGGGFNCRHTWLVDLSAREKQEQAKAA